MHYHPPPPPTHTHKQHAGAMYPTHTHNMQGDIHPRRHFRSLCIIIHVHHIASSRTSRKLTWQPQPYKVCIDSMCIQLAPSQRNRPIDFSYWFGSGPTFARPYSAMNPLRPPPPPFAHKTSVTQPRPPTVLKWTLNGAMHTRKT